MVEEYLYWWNQLKNQRGAGWSQVENWAEETRFKILRGEIEAQFPEIYAIGWVKEYHLDRKRYRDLFQSGDMIINPLHNIARQMHKRSTDIQAVSDATGIPVERFRNALQEIKLDN